MSKEKVSLADIQNPLYLHPSDGPNSLVVPKLQGAQDYRPWRRSMEISLATKRKLGFVTGSVKKEMRDEANAEQWETCNNMVIPWIHASISELIKNSILYVTTAKEVWKQLEIRFHVTNGSHKYKLNKEVYETQQNGMSVNEYYTKMKGMWEEQDSLNLLLAIAGMNVEINAFVQALNLQKDELRSF